MDVLAGGVMLAIAGIATSISILNLSKEDVFYERSKRWILWQRWRLD